VATIDPSEFASVDPARFTELVKGASRDQLAEVMAGSERAKILDEIFRRFPDQFRADRAGDTSAVIHWHIGGRADGGEDQFEVLVADGTCSTSDTPGAEPNLTVTLAAAEFLQLLSGAANPMMLFMTGKLKAKGDLALAANLANLFDLPKG
jgi:putative sterol carrier protein